MSTLSYMPFNEVADYVEVLEEEKEHLQYEVEKLKKEVDKYDALCVVLGNIAEALNVSVRTVQFKFDPENEILKAIGELQNAQTTKQAWLSTRACLATRKGALQHC